MKKKNTPPRLPHRFFRWFCHPDLVKYIEGDLIELFEERMEAQDVKKAKWLFVWDVVKLFRPSIIKPTGGTYRLNNYGMLLHYFKIGSRNLLKNRTYSAINIVGLSLGITSCIIIFSFIKYESSFDRHHEKSEQTYRVVQHTQMPDQELHWGTTAYPLAEALRNDFHDLTNVTQIAGSFQRLFTLERKSGEKIRFEEDKVLFADAHYPEIFDLEWISGNPKSALDLPNSVILTERVAEKCFGKDYKSISSILGHVILLNAKDPLTVTGIVKDPLPNTSLKFGLLISYEFFKKHNPYPSGNWSGNYGGTTFVVLQDQLKESELEFRINDWKKKYLNQEDDQRISYFLQPLSEIHSERQYASVPGDYQISKSMLNTSIFVAIFILIIAIINFINLVTAKASTRAKEVGIRKALGSHRFGLVKQFLFENSLLVVISLGIAFGLSYILLVEVNQFLSLIDMNLSFDLEGVTLIFLVSFLTILVSVVYPAIVLSSFSPIEALSNKGGHQKSNGIFARKALTLFQFTIVQLFVISSLIVGIQLRFFNGKSVGFVSDKIVLTTVPDESKIDVFRNLLLEESTIQNASFGSGPPMTVEDFALGTTYRLPHEEKLAAREAEMKIVDPNYLALYDLNLISGHNFTENKEQFDEFIVNEELVKSFNWTTEEAIGKRITINEGEATIVGVVSDFHNHSLQHQITPSVLMNWAYYRHRAFIKVNNLESLIHVENVWKELFPESIYSYSFLNDIMEREYIIEQLIYDGLKVFSLLVLVIGCLGLFGLISFITLQKTKEVGIRKILGASAIQIINYFSKEFVILILLAFVIATPLVYFFMDQWLQNFSYRIDLSPWMFIVGGVIVLLIGLAVSISESIHAANANPIDSLRDE